jgi:hypothetical protein
MNNRKKWCYILSEDITPDEPLSNYKIHKSKHLADKSQAIRFLKSDILGLVECENETYRKITNPNVTLNDINYKVIVRMNLLWEERDELHDVQFSTIPAIMKANGYIFVNDKIGYLTAEEFKSYCEMKDICK